MTITRQCLRLLADRHHELTGLRTQAACRLHVMFRELTAGGAPLRIRQLTAIGSSTAIDTDGSGRCRPADRSLSSTSPTSNASTANSSPSSSASPIAVDASGTRLTELHGVGPVTAAIILGQVRDIGRFRTRAQFANYNGTAPIEASSAATTRHRLNMRGNRALNHAIHMMAVTQVRHDTPGRAYYLRKQAEGKTRKEAMRALKRRLSDAIWRQLQLDR